ncbi:HARB1-like protein, partial [Mya arenaria]
STESEQGTSCFKKSAVKKNRNLSTEGALYQHTVKLEVPDGAAPPTTQVGDIHGVSKSSMSRHLHDVVLAINNRVDNIRFPEIDVERRSTATAFYRLSRIPRVLGAIDCTLIPITTPTTHEASYVCRKGYHALNVQAVDYLEANAVGELLGDSGYALRNYLLTPILRPTANAQVAYNDAHARGRVVVERAFCVQKSRFRCLHRSGGCLMFSPAKCQQIVICCMKLRNLCIDNGLDFNEQVIPDDQPDTFQPVAQVGLVHHQTCRNAVVQSFT